MEYIGHISIAPIVNGIYWSNILETVFLSEKKSACGMVKTSLKGQIFQNRIFAGKTKRLRHGKNLTKR